MQFEPRPHLRLQSLKGFEAFGTAMSKGQRFSARGITAFVVFRSPAPNDAEFSAPQTVFFGVTMKKRTRPAVLRNRIKRLLRESLRLALQQKKQDKKHDKNNLRNTTTVKNGEQSQEIFESIVLVCNNIPEKPNLLRLEDVLPAVKNILKRAREYYKEHYEEQHSKQINTNEVASEHISHT